MTELDRLKAKLKARKGKNEYRESIPIIEEKIAAIEAGIKRKEGGGE